MTTQETAKLMAVIQGIWPSWQQGRNAQVTITVWQKIFAAESYEEMETAVLAFASTDTRGYPPAPGNLKELLAQMRDANGDGELTDTEAWALVRRAMTRGLYNAEEEYNKLPPVIQQVVGDKAVLHDWAMLDADKVDTVIASNFQRSYRARAESARTMAKLPEGIRSMLLPELRGIGALPSERKALEAAT